MRGRLEEDGCVVLDGGEVEALGGGGIAGEGAVLAGDKVGEVCGGEFGIAYLEECTDDGTHHISEKAVGCDNKDCFVVVLDAPFGGGDVANLVFDVGVCAAERGEVLFAEEVLRRNVHGLIVQARVHLRAQSGLEGVFPGGDTIVVCACECVEACVCVGGNREEVINSDGGWEKAVESIHSLRTLVGEQRRIEMGIHHLGMYASVCPSCKSEWYG